jgi:hypothetical protein
VLISTDLQFHALAAGVFKGPVRLHHFHLHNSWPDLHAPTPAQRSQQLRHACCLLVLLQLLLVNGLADTVCAERH